MKSLDQNRINADIAGYPMHEIICAMQRNWGELELLFYKNRNFLFSLSFWKGRTVPILHESRLYWQYEFEKYKKRLNFVLYTFKEN